MKRSKMLKDLAEVLKTLDMENVTLNPLVKAEAILSYLEEKGMTPPRTSKVKQLDILDRWGQDTGVTDMVRVLETEWDNES